MPGFLIDENMPPVIAAQMLHHKPRIQATVIGRSGAPLKGTADPQLLCWIEENDYVLVTNNRASMPGHLRDHMAAGSLCRLIATKPRQAKIRFADMGVFPLVSRPSW